MKIQIPSKAVRERDAYDTILETTLDGFGDTVFSIRALNARFKRFLKKREGLDADIALRGDDEEAVKLVCHLVVGWTDDLEDAEGQLIQYSFDNTKALAELLRAQDFALPVVKKAHRAIQEIAEAEAKNSSSS